MKKKLTNNLGMKLLSVAAAVVIWLIIVNIEDVVMTKPITIPVQELNASALEKANKTYEVVSGGTATITVRGRTSVVSGLDAEDFIATADLSNVSVTGAVPVDVSLKDSVKNKGSVSIIQNNNVYKIALEDIKESTIQITPRARGKVADGYSIGKVTVTPNMINVSGSESRVNSIKEAVVEIDVSGCSENVKTTLTPVFYSQTGEIMDTKRLQMDVEQVTVEVELLKTKDVPVKLELSGEPAYGYKVVSVDSSPEQAKIAGSQEALDKVDSITVSYDISGIAETFEGNVMYENLPEGISLADENDTKNGLSVKIVVEKIEEMSLEVDFDAIELLNKRDGYQYRLSSGNKVAIRLSGAPSILKTVAIDDLKLTADVSALTAGYSYHIPVKAENIGNKDFTILGQTMDIFSEDKTKKDDET